MRIQLLILRLDGWHKPVNISAGMSVIGVALMSPPREIELKLEVPIASLPGVGRCSPLKDADPSARKSARVVSVYFDTKKLKLRRNALSLRLRRIGRRVVQTIKQETGATTFVRNEWEHDIGAKQPGAKQPDFEVAKGTPLGPLLNRKLRRGLKPVFETRVRRSVFQLQSGGSEIELSIDKGTIEAGRRSQPISEVELELKRGQSAGLFKLAKMLAEEVPVQLAVKSKAERGYALLTAERPKAVKAAPVVLTPHADVQSAFQIIAWGCVHQLVANQPIMLGGDPEGLHQMRVALRRLRAAISLFSDMLTDAQTEALKAELKWITRELGPARELDIFFKRVVKPVVDGKPNGAGVAVLSRDLRQQREDAITRAHAATEGARFRDLVLDTAAWIEAGNWMKNPDITACTLRELPIAAAAAEQLQRRWKKLVKRGRHLDKLDAQRRHRLRIQAKKLRYAAEFFASAFPRKKSTRRQEDFVASLEKVQGALGDLNDIAVHGELSERFVEGGDAGGKGRVGRARKAFAAGRLSGREEARIAPVLKDAKRAYQAFAKARPFWS
jgi:triphosphatase